MEPRQSYLQGRVRVPQSAINGHTNNNEAGTFASGAAPPAFGSVSGSPIASFLLGAVENANFDLGGRENVYPRQSAFVLHVGTPESE